MPISKNIPDFNYTVEQIQEIMDNMQARQIDDAKTLSGSIAITPIQTDWLKPPNPDDLVYDCNGDVVLTDSAKRIVRAAEMQQFLTPNVQPQDPTTYTFTVGDKPTAYEAQEARVDFWRAQALARCGRSKK